MAMKRIPKKLVTKSTYHICTILFHLLCLSGSIWQITLVSVKFFKFEVTKNTHLVLPEEQNNTGKVLYICFENHEYMDYKMYDKMMFEKYIYGGISLTSYRTRERYKRITISSSSVEDRFRISPKARIIINFSDTIDFISGSKYCTQVFNYTTRKIIILKSNIANITRISLSIGTKLPGFDHRRLHDIDKFGEPEQSMSIGISSYSYTIKKLERPYTDNCHNYSSTNQYPLRRLAIEYCKNNLSMEYNNSLSEYHVCYPGERHNNLTIKTGKTFDEQCHKKYPQFDCIQSLFFVKTESKVLNLKTPTIYLSSAPGKDPSFIIVSKASIDNIDFLTYVLGALGAWIGFSFIGINPVPFLLKYSEELPVRKNSSTGEKKLWKEVITSRNIIFSLRQELSHFKQSFDAMEQNHKSDIEKLNNRIDQDCKSDIAKLNDKVSKLIRDIYSKKL